MGSIGLSAKPVSVEINELLQVKIVEDGNGLTYPSRVDDLVAGKVVISWPTDHGVRLPLREQQGLSLTFVRQDAAYSFDATVEDRRQYPIPQLVIRPSGAAQRIQRRQYYRVRTAIPLELSGTLPPAHPGTQDNVIHIKTHTHDISGSGIGFRHTSSLPPGTVLEAKLILPGELPAIKLVSKVIHSDAVPPESDRPLYHVGLYFLSITEPERSRIIRHVFRIQQTVQC